MGVDRRKDTLNRGLNLLFSGSIFVVLELLSLKDITRLDEALCSSIRQQWFKILEPIRSERQAASSPYPQ